jgi:undecaprenyl-diphosphatase
LNGFLGELVGIFHAILLGLVEGITAYLPVSADGHIIILGSLLAEPPELVKSFGVALQAAPTLAVLILYWRRFEALVVPGVAGNSSFKGARAWQLYALGTLPVLSLGFLLKEKIYPLHLSPWPSVAGLGLGALGILWAESSHKEKGSQGMDDLSSRQALIIGLCQCLALWPGVSRSGATIVAGLLLGLTRKGAAEFSFLVGAPVFAAAAALEFHHSAVLKENLGTFGIAFGVAFVFALLSVRLFMKLLEKGSFRPYAWYRLALIPLLWTLFR